MIDMRVSDGYSMAETFSASNETGFVQGCRDAVAALRRRGALACQLHVRLANGDWIAPTYRFPRAGKPSLAQTPDGYGVTANTRIYVDGSAQPWLWTWVLEAKEAGDAFTGRLGSLKQFIAGDDPDLG